jgi:hypothetical protein
MLEYTNTRKHSQIIVYRLCYTRTIELLSLEAISLEDDGFGIMALGRTPIPSPVLRANAFREMVEEVTFVSGAFVRLLPCDLVCNSPCLL